MDFGQRLTDARKKKGISQESLAEAVGVSRQAVSKWETGESKPDVSNLIAICNTLDLNVEYLCLGKVPASEQVSVKQNRPLWLKALLFSIAIAIAVFAGVLIGSMVVSTTDDTHVNEQMQTFNIENISVVNANATYVLDEKCYEITVTPNLLHEDIQVMLRIENTAHNGQSPMTVACELENSEYKWKFVNPQQDVEYRITAIFVYDEVQKQIPVMLFHASEGSCGYVHLWENHD